MRDTKWLREAKWGVFFHFLSDEPGAGIVGAGDALTPDEWNRRVEALDAPALAEQLESIGAGYLGLTIGQNSGYYCAPNATYDRIVGREPSRCSRRDLVADVADALRPRGIRLMAYLPGKAPRGDVVAREALHHSATSHGDETDATQRRAKMQTLWNQVIREWSLRWGDQVSAWWIDGVYTADAMYRHADEPNFDSLMSALRAGNPDALVALNPGAIRGGLGEVVGSGEDFTAGEADYVLPVPGTGYDGQPLWPADFLGGKQLHILTFLGQTWRRGAPRFPDEMVKGYTQLLNAHGGTVSWDVPLTPRGLIAPEFVRPLQGLKNLRG